MRFTTRTVQRRSVRPFLLGGTLACLVLAFSVTQAQRFRDSAGVRVAAYDTRDRPLGHWRIDLKSRLTIGGSASPGPMQFSMIAGVSRLVDHSIAVANLSTSEIRLFDSTGRYIRSFGRRGRKAGEFPFIWELWNLADTLMGVDGNGIGQMFLPTGTYVRTVPRPSVTGRKFERLGYWSDGSYLAYAPDPVDAAPVGISVDSITLARMGSGAPRVLLRFAGQKILRQAGKRATRLVYGPHFAAAVFSERFCLGYSADYSFICFDSRGKILLRFSRTACPTREVRAEDRNQYFAGIDKANPGELGAAYRREVREDAVFAARMPCFGRFIASRSAELWIGPLVPGDATLGTMNPTPHYPTSWAVFSMDGKWLSDVELPEDFRPMEAGPDYVAGIQRGIDNVERVVVYRVLRQ